MRTHHPACVLLYSGSLVRPPRPASPYFGCAEPLWSRRAKHQLRPKWHTTTGKNTLNTNETETAQYYSNVMVTVRAKGRNSTQTLYTAARAGCGNETITVAVLRWTVLVSPLLECNQTALQAGLYKSNQIRSGAVLRDFRTTRARRRHYTCENFRSDNYGGTPFLKCRFVRSTRARASHGGRAVYSR